ncbi:MAG: cytochrome c biogenesis protein CcdA [Bacteroidota bacterium]|nr:cytochrome c biogenesis protein CcdA [Bacteroidota bacterium]
MRKSFLLIFMMLLAVITLNAQILKPVKWSFSTNRLKDNEAELILKATIDNKWHLYSQKIPSGGPIPTSFKFEKSDNYMIEGKVSEPKAIEEFDQNFDMKLSYFANQVVFKQKIKILSKKPFKINGSLEFMCCNDKQCLPPATVDFEFNPEDLKAVESASKSVVKNNDVEKPILKDYKTENKENITKTDTVKSKKEILANEHKKEGKSLWWIFIAGFIGGLIALLTPCVFPMIPMTVSFFLKKADKKEGIEDAIIYGISIIIIYVALGFGITLLFGADALNMMATNSWFNLFFFILLVIFSAAFFGAFELQLPSKWVNAIDSRADRTGGLIGIFFMAFTLALVSFSCTGPIIGTLLVEAASTKSRLSPLLGMTGFALALSIPFTFFAIFPTWLKKMPKSGGWLNSVKVVFGFLELALALKFLSTADLASHWGILSRETFIVLWIVIFTMMGFYILGKLKLAHDSDLPYITVTRLFLAIISFSFALYMLPGLWGAPLKAISAFTPPMSTQDFDMNAISQANHQASDNSEKIMKKNDNLFHSPHGINGFYDYDEGMAYAKKMSKPVMLDFTGWGCVNCRNMEAKVWSDPEVLKRIKENYVLISLYVDDKTELPEIEKKTEKLNDDEYKLTTIGNKWSFFQAKKFGTNSQPYYVLLDNKGNSLTEPRAFDLDINAYVNFLDKGLREYRKRIFSF